MDKLVSLFGDSLLKREDLIARGEIPIPVIVGIEPAKENAEMTAAFSSLMGMSTMIRLFAAINQIQAAKDSERNTPYNINDPEQIAMGFQDRADATLRTLSGGAMAFVYEQVDSTTLSVVPALRREEIQPFILKTILSGISQINADTSSALSEYMKDFIKDLKPFKIVPSPEHTKLSHCILINYVKSIDLTGGGKIFVLERYTRLVHLKIKIEDWTHALTKPPFLKRNEKIPFAVDFTIADYKLDEGKYQAAKPKWERVVQIIPNEDNIKEILDKGGIEAFGRNTVFLAYTEG